MNTLVSYTFKSKDGAYHGDGDITVDYPVNSVDSIKKVKEEVNAMLQKDTGLKGWSVVIRWIGKLDE